MTNPTVQGPVLAITGGRRDQRGSVLIPSPVQMDQFVRLLDQLKPSEVRHGDAVGTDRYVKFFLEKGSCWIGNRFYLFTFRTVAFPVNPELDGEWPLAGHRRNGRMLKTDPPVEVLVAFPGGSGTENCIEQAIDSGQGRVTVYRWRGDREKGEFAETYDPFRDRPSVRSFTEGL